MTTITFACILVNGKNVWPMLPLSLLTNIESRMPMLMKVQLWENNLEKKREKEYKREPEGVDAVLEKDLDDIKVEVPVDIQAEEESVRNRVLTDSLTKSIENEGELYGGNSIMNSSYLAYNKAILKLIAVECSNQEIEKAL